MTMGSEVERPKDNYVFLSSVDEGCRQKVSVGSYEEDILDGIPQFWKNVYKVKNELEATLSDPLRRRAAGSIKRACDRAVSIRVASSVKRKVTELSNRFTVPKFLLEQHSALSSSLSGIFIYLSLVLVKFDAAFLGFLKVIRSIVFHSKKNWGHYEQKSR